MLIRRPSDSLHAEPCVCDMCGDEPEALVRVELMDLCLSCVMAAATELKAALTEPLDARSKLRSCPFCGLEPNAVGLRITCANVACAGYTVLAADGEWNHRTPDAPNI